jgi:hypothetical protein
LLEKILQEIRVSQKTRKPHISEIEVRPPENPKLKLRKTQIDLTGSAFRKIHSRVVPKKRDPRNLGCSQSPRKKRDPQKNPSGRDPREFPIGPQGPPTKIPEK